MNNFKYEVVIQKEIEKYPSNLKIRRTFDHKEYLPFIEWYYKLIPLGLNDFKSMKNENENLLNLLLKEMSNDLELKDKQYKDSEMYNINLSPYLEMELELNTKISFLNKLINL